MEETYIDKAFKEGYLDLIKRERPKKLYIHPLIVREMV